VEAEVSIVSSKLHLEYIDGRNWLLLEPFRAYSDVAHGWIEVPEAFITDFNSQPIGLWNILPPTDYGEAAVLHDFLYRYGRLNGIVVDRGFADRVHREFLRWKGAPTWKVDAYYYGLRLGGWLTWRRYRKAEREAEHAA
jgi:hypothetical protein